MAQHGYLGDDYGTRYDPNWDEDDDSERRREWRGERERGAMFGRDREWRDRDQYRNRDDERGVFSRMGDEARSWLRDDDNERGPRDWRRSDANEWFGGRSEREQASRSFSSNRDDHYRNWRDKQMQALDRDYEDYCREREQQFHQDFDSWRQNRQQPQGQVTTRFDPTGSSSDSLNEPQATVDPESAATLGTGSDTSAGRRKG